MSVRAAANCLARDFFFFNSFISFFFFFLSFSSNNAFSSSNADYWDVLETLMFFRSKLSFYVSIVTVYFSRSTILDLELGLLEAAIITSFDWSEDDFSVLLSCSYLSFCNMTFIFFCIESSFFSSLLSAFFSSLSAFY